jgi:hypothetical protein
MGGNLHRLKRLVCLIDINDLRGRFLRSDGDEVPPRPDLVTEKRIDHGASLAENSQLYTQK